MIVAEVIADDQWRRHVQETWTNAVQETVSQKEPLWLLNKRRPDTADSQYRRAQQTTGTVAVTTAYGTYEANGQRGERQRHTERQCANPVWKTTIAICNSTNDVNTI